MLEAFAAIRKGRFDEAFEISDAETRKNIDNFYGWYLAAVSLGFMDKRTTFQHYIERAALLEPDYPYISYLRAYTKLWNEDIEGALLEWTKLIDIDEGWLARDLIEKARKGANLLEKAVNGDISYFIVLPDFSEFESEEKHVISEEKYSEKMPETRNRFFEKEKKTPFFSTAWIKYVLLFFVISVLIFTFKNKAWDYIESLQRSKPEIWRNFKIDEWAALVNLQNRENIKYEYKIKDRLIEDFENAKKMLAEKKINQARFLLQRIIQSNADFKTKEKSKIFLNFIPEPNYQDFSDPVFPDKILRYPDFYEGCLVLWQGSVLKMHDVDHGKEVRLLIKDADSDYIIDAFLQSKESKPDWLPFSDFQANKEISKTKPQAIIYGKYKGLVGDQKTIYLELIQLWM